MKRSLPDGVSGGSRFKQQGRAESGLAGLASVRPQERK